MDFDHNHKNSWNMLMGRVLMTLTGVMFSILTIRTLWLHTDNDDSQFKFLTLQHVAPKNKMLSELARTVHLAVLRTLSELSLCRPTGIDRPGVVTSRHARMFKSARGQQNNKSTTVQAHIEQAQVVPLTSLLYYNTFHFISIRNFEACVSCRRQIDIRL